MPLCMDRKTGSYEQARAPQMHTDAPLRSARALGRRVHAAAAAEHAVKILQQAGHGG
jgi:hypothetical protein